MTHPTPTTYKALLEWLHAEIAQDVDFPASYILAFKDGWSACLSRLIREGLLTLRGEQPVTRED